MNPVNYPQILQLAAPETIVTLTVLVVLGADVTVLRGKSIAARFNVGALLSILGCASAACLAFTRHLEANLFNGLLVVNPASDFVKVALLALTIFTVLISTSGKFTNHVGEYLSLILLGTIGLMFLVSTEDLLMIFIALEFASLALYILTAFNKHNEKSAEAALKYFLFGGMSAAFLLFGFSLLYGISGSTNLREIAIGIVGKGFDPLLLVALVTTVIGFGFKVAAVPFHLWAPDAYEVRRRRARRLSAPVRRSRASTFSPRFSRSALSARKAAPCGTDTFPAGRRSLPSSPRSRWCWAISPPSSKPVPNAC